AQESKVNRPEFISLFVYNDKAYQFHIPNKEMDNNTEKLQMNIIPVFENVYDIETFNFNKTELERNHTEKLTFQFAGIDSRDKSENFLRSLE
ncbi:hypothetical protein, partial [Leptospira bandrabouensis]